MTAERGQSYSPVRPVRHLMRTVSHRRGSRPQLSRDIASRHPSPRPRRRRGRAARAPRHPPCRRRRPARPRAVAAAPRRRPPRRPEAAARHRPRRPRARAAARRRRSRRPAAAARPRPRPVTAGSRRRQPFDGRLEPRVVLARRRRVDGEQDPPRRERKFLQGPQPCSSQSPRSSPTGRSPRRLEELGGGRSAASSARSARPARDPHVVRGRVLTPDDTERVRCHLRRPLGLVTYAATLLPRNQREGGILWGLLPVHAPMWPCRRARHIAHRARGRVSAY